jgi:hypothetical protein
LIHYQESDAPISKKINSEEPPIPLFLREEGRVMGKFVFIFPHVNTGALTHPSHED